MRKSANTPGPPGWSILGVLLGAAGYVLALTPSLLPRTSLTQAAVCALVAMTGYAIGAIIEGTPGAVVRKIRSRASSSHGADPHTHAPPHRGRVYWIKVAVAITALLAAALFTPRSAGWQVTQLEVTKVQGNAPESVFVIGVTAIMCIVLLMIARGLRAAGRGFAHLINRWTRGRWPFTIRTILGGLMVFACVAIVCAIGIAASFPIFDNVNNKTAGQTQPTSSLRSGGPGSLVSWQSLGNQGRNFVGQGPAAEQIAQVTDRAAKEPIRTYAGVESADSNKARAQLAVSDLVRAGGLDRDSIVAYTPSTNGLVDPISSAAAEYVLGGNVASVSIQYTVLPSFMSLILSTQQSLDAGTQLLSAVRAAVNQRPVGQRPKVYVYGESLGAFGSMAPFTGKGVAGLLDQVDGALWAGPPGNSAYWQEINALSTSGPAWAPIVDDGLVIRYAATPGGIKEPPKPWGGIRGLFLQNATDPVVWAAPDLALKRPAWLDAPRGPQVPPEMTWFPIVTFEQVLIDLPPAGAMPPGVGHNYLITIGDAWTGVLQPPFWTEANHAKLQTALYEGAADLGLVH